MLMMRPQPRFSIAGSAQRIAWNAADRFSAMIASQRSTGNSLTFAVCWMPALFTRMSTAPARASIPRISDSTSAGFIRSAFT